MTMDQLLADPFPRLTTMAMPSTDIWTEGSDLFVKVHLQGFAKEDVSASLEGGDLVIRAHHQESEKEKKKNYIVRESTNSFVRRVHLPDYAELQKITAELADGVLTVKIPTGAVPETTSIPITGA